MGLVGGAMRMSTEGTFQVEGTANGEVLGGGLGAWVQTEGRRVWRVVVAGQGREGLGGRTGGPGPLGRLHPSY